MERQLPELLFGGTKFRVDIQNGCFVQADDASNKIEFYHLIYKDNHNELDYNPATKKEHYLFDDPEGVLLLKIPRLIELDPVGVAQKYGIDQSSLKYLRDSDMELSREKLLEKMDKRLAQSIIEKRKLKRGKRI